MARKVVFVPRPEIGTAVRDALHLRRAGRLGLTCTTPEAYAQRVAWPYACASGRTVAPPGTAFLAVARFLQTRAAGERPRLQSESDLRRLTRPLARAVHALRMDEQEPGDLDAAGDLPDVALLADRHLVEACHRAYEAFLADEELYDKANLFRWAAGEVRTGRASEPSETVYALFDTVACPERVRAFLDALRAAASAFYRIGPDHSRAVPPASVAGACFAAVPTPRGESFPPTRSRDGLAGLDRDRLSFCTAVGAAAEVRLVYRTILERGLSLDRVEIAYAAETPYRSLLTSTAEYLDLPLTLGAGYPTAASHPGRALAGFYDWVADNLAAPVLIRLLRGGLFRLDRSSASSGAEASLPPHAAATLLASRRYERGRRGYAKALQALERELADEIERHEAADADAQVLRRRLEQVRVLRSAIGRLLERVPSGPTTVQAMAEVSLDVLSTFGPVDPPEPRAPEVASSRNEAAYVALSERLRTVARLRPSFDVSVRQAIGMLQDLLSEEHGQAQPPRPGHVHAVPLAEAGYAGRPHLFVVGLDNESMTASMTRDVRSEEAGQAAPSTPFGEPGLEAVDRASWDILRALGRHTGTAVLVARTFDVAQGEALFPSSLYLQLQQAAGDEGDSPPSGFLPSETTPAWTLDDRASWLAAYAAGRTRGTRSTHDTEPTPDARTLVERCYPWCRHGREASTARASDVYTVYDGLLRAGDYPALDFLCDAYQGGPLSATRLQTLAEAPYLYFLRYVLGVEPLDEPALDDTAWLHRRRRGEILHDAFERFMQHLDGTSPEPAHEDRLIELLDTRLEEEKDRLAPPSRHVEQTTRSALHDDARIFLRAEVEHAGTAEHVADRFEFGFGFGPHRQRAGDAGALTLALGPECVLPVRGRIDRIDRQPDGCYAIWDYKTGSAKHYDPDDPLQNGATLQWALYAYALEAIEGVSVGRSGYFFTSTAELGMRLVFDPKPVRDDVAGIVRRLARMARAGCFPMTPALDRCRAWSYGTYDRIEPDRRTRGRALRRKTYPDDRPRPPFLD